MLFSWLSRDAALHIGAIIDVNDGRIDAALALSDPEKSEPEILWSHTELFHTRLKKTAEANLKQALGSAFAALSGSGLKSLLERGLPARVSLIQASLHSPFAYTVARNVTVRDNKPFRVTRDLVRDLEWKAEADALKLQSARVLTEGLSLKPLSSSAVALSLNGYPTRYAFRSATPELSICQHISLSSIDFPALLKEARDKYLPGARIDADSFASLLYRAVSALSPESLQYSLVAIGSGATEFFTVRDGLPENVSFIPVGLERLGDELAAAAGLLPHEARSLVKRSEVDHAALQSQGKKAAAAKILQRYEGELRALLSGTGDTLALPKTIFLLADCDYESYFASLLERVAKDVTGTKHAVYPITSDFFDCDGPRDPALLCLAHCFHHQLYEDDYLDLLARRENG